MTGFFQSGTGRAGSFPAPALHKGALDLRDYGEARGWEGVACTLMLVAGLSGELLPSTLPPPKALQAQRLHQLSPSAAILDAETCVQTKKEKGGGPGS